MVLEKPIIFMTMIETFFLFLTLYKNQLKMNQKF
jgi:hypothetical protein